MGNLRYSKEYSLHVYDLGHDGRLAPHALFNYLQDIASEHAVRLRFGKDDLLRENRFWVLSRITAEIYLWPEWEDKVIVTTWPRGTDRLFALRDFVVKLADGRDVASASSSWLVLDRTTRKVQRPDSLLTHLISDLPAEKSLGRNAGKLEPVEERPDRESPFRVRTSDLDINLHTNNVIYVKWVLDTYPLDFRADHIPSGITVNYLAESRIDDDLFITKPEGRNNTICNHAVVRCDDNTEICRVRVEWKSCRL